MASLMKRFVLLIVAILLPACAPERVSTFRNFESASSSTVQTQQKPRTACVSFQGNGVYFASHVGALISLLENNFEPVFATGGSSGAILASVSRALAENPSLSYDGVFRPYDAARVLAASAPIIESVLFLPRFTTPLALLDSLDVFMTGSSLGVLRADPTDGLVNAESIVGQATLVIDYYRSTDFGGVLSKRTVHEREREVARLWKSFANTIDVTPEQFADAILTSRETLAENGESHLVEIQDRFFKLYRSKTDGFRSNYKTQQESWNNFIGPNAKVFGLDSQERRQALFKKLMPKIKTLESFDALAATLSGQFMLADPDRVFRAFEGYDSRNNRRIEIPSNVIIHSTARRAKRENGEWKEAKGISGLHQVYFTNPNQAPHVAERLAQPERNPLRPSNDKLQPVIPTERLVVTSQLLGPTLAATTGEPTAFLRFPIDLDVPARLRLGWTNVNETLVGFGGWLEKVSLGTARQFALCESKNVDAYFYTSDGEGVNRFAKMAFLGLFLDTPMRGLLGRQLQNPTDMRALLAGTGAQTSTFSADPNMTEFDAVVGSADSIFSDNRTAKGRMGHIPVHFNYVTPSEVKGDSAPELNVAIRSNRRAMVLAAYEFARRSFTVQGITSVPQNLWNISGDKVSVLTKDKSEDIQSVVDKAFPRLNY
jgi:hypothetical protein